MAQRTQEGEAFGYALANFLDHHYSLQSKEARLQTLAAEPPCVAELPDAYLAAVAEHLAWLAQAKPPAWSNAPTRFLTRAHFASGLESLKATLLVESPTAFRRRQLFVSANALSRA